METDRKALEGAMRSVVGAVSSRPGIPALGGVLVDFDGSEATLTTTDLETTARAVVPAIGEPFRALVPAKMLQSAVTASTGERIALSPAESDRVQVGKVRIRLLPAEDFPTIPEVVGASFPANLEDFARAFVAVEAATSKDTARPVLTGMLFRVEGSHVTLVATDSYRLHVADVVAGVSPAEWQAIVPPHGILGELKRERTRCKKLGGAVTVTCGAPAEGWGPHVMVTFPNGVRIITQTIAGEFPNWQQLMPDPSAEFLTFDRDELAEVIRLVGLMARDTSPIRFDLNGSVIVRASSPDLGDAEATVESGRWNGEGGELSAAFNPGYFAGALTATEASRIDFRDGLKPITFRGSNVRALVMPVRLPAAV